MQGAVAMVREGLATEEEVDSAPDSAAAEVVEMVVG